MFILPDGRPISPDVPFTLNEISYPANFLRLATPEERAAIGITEQPDPAPYDQRFYWGYDQNNQLIPKDHAQLVEQWVAQTRTTANTLMQPTDWIIIREADNGKVADPVIKTWREQVRLAAGSKVYEIEHTVDTPALAAYVTSQDYSSWPPDPNAPAPRPEASSPSIVDGVTSGPVLTSTTLAGSAGADTLAL